MITGHINQTEYKEKILGCWLGKNIGGTLGAPFEGTRTMLDLKFYAQELSGVPAPNDDLDLQLLWLEMIERHGLQNLTPRLFGEFWMDYITAGWNEYGISCGNMQNGFFPPVSGQLNNPKWYLSNGAWIRSEIWACLFPGNPETACRYAWMDACCDHKTDGIYAELFMAAFESMAFVCSDVRTLIHDALEFIPEDCRVAKAIRLTVDMFDEGKDLKTIREALVKTHEDIGYFQAPLDLGFVIAGLLFGGGDFEKTLLAAVNCGDDTDCTAGSAGAIMGIIYGIRAIPEKWAAPIGHGIRTVCINVMHNNIQIPDTIEELTDRIAGTAMLYAQHDPDMIRIDSDPTQVEGKFTPVSPVYTDAVMKQSSDWMDLPLGSGVVRVSYPDGAEIAPGGTLKLILDCGDISINRMEMRRIRFHLPEGWSISPCEEIMLRRSPGSCEILITAPEKIPDMVTHLVFETVLSGRFYPEFSAIPVQTVNAVRPESHVLLIHRPQRCFEWNQRKLFQENSLKKIKC